MPSIRETILQALHAALQTQPAPVLRGEVLPERVPATGLLILRDGDPGEPEVTLSPLDYHYQHRAEVEAVVQGTGRDAAFDALCASIGMALGQNRTLGGVCDWVEAEAPQPVDLPVEGAATLKAAVIPIVLHYASPRSPRLIEEGHRHGTCTRGAGADGVRVRGGLRHPAGGGELLADAVRELDARVGAAAARLGAARLRARSAAAGAGRGDADGEIVVPIDLRAWGVWLKAAFGAPTTTGTGPYAHEFRSGDWTLPSLAIELGMPEVPHYAMNSGAVVNTLAWTMQRSGLLTATVGLIAQGETVAGASATGATSDFEIVRFGQFNGAVERDGAALGSIVSAQISYSNNLDRIETIRNDGMIEGADPSIAALDRHHRGALRRPDAAQPGGGRRGGGAEVQLHPQRQRGLRADSTRGLPAEAAAADPGAGRRAGELRVAGGARERRRPHVHRDAEERRAGL